jgi:hypothetical protein
MERVFGFGKLGQRLRQKLPSAFSCPLHAMAAAASQGLIGFPVFDCAQAQTRYTAAMTTEQIVGLVLTLLLMSAGVLGSILPGLPSTPLVLIAAIGHKLYFGDASAAWWVILLMAGFAGLAMLMDYLATMYGAKKLGATWRGALGAILGALIGLFYSLPGVILGPFVGAVAFELAGGRSMKESSLAGVGAVLGLLAGALGKLACCLAMTGLFVVNVLYRSAS